MRKVWFECAKLIEHAFRREPMELEEEEEEVYWALPTQKMIMEIDAEDYLDLPRSTRKERVAAKEYDMRKIECAYPLLDPVMSLIQAGNGGNAFKLPHTGITKDMRENGGWDI